MKRLYHIEYIHRVSLLCDFLHACNDSQHMWNLYYIYYPIQSFCQYELTLQFGLMVKMNQILRFYHFVYIHSVPPHYGLFYTFEDIHHGKSIYYMVHIYNILFLYEIFFIFEENWKNAKLYHTNSLHKFPYSVSLHIPSIQGFFCSVSLWLYFQ